MTRFFKAVLMLLCVASLVSAQSTRPYSKKVVSFVNQVVAPSSASLSTRHADFIGASVEENMNMPRFHFAPLPETYVLTFRSEMGGRGDYSADQIKGGIEKYLAPPLLALIDANKEAFSKQNLTDADKNSFLATKAQAAGLSAAQLESILNSGFFFVPYLESYKRTADRKEREEKNDKGEVKRRVKYTDYTHEMELGVLWYQLQIDKSNKASVVFVGQAKGWNGSAISRTKSQDDGSDGNADWEAFAGAVEASCKNIALGTKTMEQFQLVGGVTETTGMGMMLSIGTREGVHLDDTYWIEELEENEQGQIQKNRRGFVKIRNVGDNKEDAAVASYAQSISGSNYSPGLSAAELPLIGVNVLLSGAMMPMKIGAFGSDLTPGLMVADPTYGFGLSIPADTKNAFGAMAAVQMSLAHATNISELWFHLGVQGGVVKPEGEFYFPVPPGVRMPAPTTEIGTSLTGSIDAGLEKKFYVKRFGLFLQADAKFAILRLTSDGKPRQASGDAKYTLTNSGFGGDLRAGLETYISPKVMFGVAAEYNLFGANDTWTVKVTDNDDKELMKKEDVKGPEVNFGGLGVYAWINLAIPSFN
jgi:hypothetical protein